MDYHITWYECLYRDNVQWPWHGSIPQRSRSHEAFNGQSTNACVSAITYLCIEASIDDTYLCIEALTCDIALLWTALYKSEVILRMLDNKIKTCKASNLFK